MSRKKYNYKKNEEGKYICEHCEGYGPWKHKGGFRSHMRDKHPNLVEEDNKNKKPKTAEEKTKVKIQRIISSTTSRSKLLKDVQNAIQDFNTSKRKLSRKLENVEYSSKAKFIALLGISDLHYGNVNVNMDYVDRLLNFVMNEPRAYCFLNGDIIDNWVEISPKGGVYEQTVPPALQKEIMIEKLKPLKDKILAIVTGNHEARSGRAGEQNPTEQMAKELDIPYLGPGGRINLTLNKNTYKIHIRHKYRYNSSFNPCHSCGRLVENLDSEADVVCIGHNHDPAIEVRYKAGKKRSFVRFGSSMPSTMYSETLGFQKTALKAPTLILSGEEFLHHPFMDIEIVKEFIKRKENEL